MDARLCPLPPLPPSSASFGAVLLLASALLSPRLAAASCSPTSPPLSLDESKSSNKASNTAAVGARSSPATPPLPPASSPTAAVAGTAEAPAPVPCDAPTKTRVAAGNLSVSKSLLRCSRDPSWRVTMASYRSDKPALSSAVCSTCTVGCRVDDPFGLANPAMGVAADVCSSRWRR